MCALRVHIWYNKRVTVVVCCGCDIRILFSCNCVTVFSASWTWESRYVLQVAVGTQTYVQLIMKALINHAWHIWGKKMRNEICSAFHFPNKTGKFSVRPQLLFFNTRCYLCVFLLLSHKRNTYFNPTSIKSWEFWTCSPTRCLIIPSYCRSYFCVLQGTIIIKLYIYIYIYIIYIN